MKLKHTFTVARLVVIASVVLASPKIQHYSTNVKHIISIPEFTQAEIKELKCLTANLFFEARGEGALGLKAVAEVTINRSNSPKYPSDICKVVFQTSQFSWTFEQSKANIKDVLAGNLANYKLVEQKAYKQAQEVAYKAYTSKNKLLPTNALFYHTKTVKPYWADKFIKVAVIGNHVFYKEG